jgi:hypothetical protein
MWEITGKKRIISALIVFLFAAPLCNASAEIMRTGPNTYAAGVYTVNFSTAKQEGNFWCWAACIEMVLRYRGLDVSQDAIVQKIFGARVDTTGQPEQILQALWGEWPNVADGTSKVYTEGYKGLFPNFVQDLINGYPLIVGLNFGTQTGHAVVLTAVSFTTDVYGRYYPLSVVFRDPWPGNLDRQEMPFQTFLAGCFFSARVGVFPN